MIMTVFLFYPGGFLYLNPLPYLSHLSRIFKQVSLSVETGVMASGWDVVLSGLCLDEYSLFAYLDLGLKGIQIVWYS